MEGRIPKGGKLRLWGRVRRNLELGRGAPLRGSA